MLPLPCRSVIETHFQGKGTRKKFFPHFLDYGNPFSWFLWLERWILYLSFSFHICASSQPHNWGLPSEQYCKSKERKKIEKIHLCMNPSLSVDSFLKLLPAFVFFSLLFCLHFPDNRAVECLFFSSLFSCFLNILSNKAYFSILSNFLLCCLSY